MLESLITSKTRIKILLKFFLNPETHAYLRELSSEFGESSNGIRIELNRLTKAKLLKTANKGRTIIYQANTNHSFFKDLQRVVQKYVGIDYLVNEIVDNLGAVEAAYITGDYARGIDSGIIDLVLIGKVNQEFLQKAVEKTSLLISRKVRTLILTVEELDALNDQLDMKHALLIWNAGNEERNIQHNAKSSL